MREWLLVGCGGFFGAILRWALSDWVRLSGRGALFPYGTLAVNVLGCFAIGFLVQLGEAFGLVGPTVRSFVLVGFLGAFTTFSTFSLETVNLLLEGKGLVAGANLTAHVVMCVGGVVAGRALVLWGSAAWSS
jgi:CrcB protein